MRDRILLAVFFALILTAQVMSLSSCRHPETVAYKVEQGTRVSAEAAMTAWGKYVSEFKPPVEQERKVQAAFDKYRDAQLLLLDAAIAVKSAQGGTNTLTKITLDNATQDAAHALADLLGLLRSLNIKL